MRIANKYNLGMVSNYLNDGINRLNDVFTAPLATAVVESTFIELVRVGLTLDFFICLEVNLSCSIV